MFGRLEPQPGRFPLSGGERTRSRWRKWHRISESWCRLDVLSSQENTNNNFTEVNVDLPRKRWIKRKHGRQGAEQRNVGSAVSSGAAGLKLLSPPRWRGLRPGEGRRGRKHYQKYVGTFSRRTLTERQERAARRRRRNETAALGSAARRRRPVLLLPFLRALMKSLRRAASFWEAAWALGGCVHVEGR